MIAKQVSDLSGCWLHRRPLWNMLRFVSPNGIQLLVFAAAAASTNQCWHFFDFARRRINSQSCSKCYCHRYLAKTDRTSATFVISNIYSSFDLLLGARRVTVPERAHSTASMTSALSLWIRLGRLGARRFLVKGSLAWTQPRKFREGTNLGD